MMISSHADIRLRRKACDDMVPSGVSVLDDRDGATIGLVYSSVLFEILGVGHMSKSNEDDLRDILNNTALEIAQMYPNPRTWQSWMVYLMERLEAKAVENPAYTESFKEMIVSLQDELRNRVKTGGW
jgi:hypothetical protein